MKRHVIAFFLDEKGRIGIDSKGDFNIMELCFAMQSLQFSYLKSSMMGTDVTKQFGAETFDSRLKK